MKCNINGRYKNNQVKGDKRLKEIVENLDDMKIGLDDSFKFHCTMCGRCCVNREDILLTPKDIYNIARELNKNPVDVLNSYCEWYIGSNSRVPIVRLLPQGYNRRCPLLNGNKCSVHRSKPAVCAMFPIGRCLTADAEKAKTGKIEFSEIQYIFTKPGCGDDAETHTVREWLSEFGMETEDQYFIHWHYTISEAGAVVRKLEKAGGKDSAELLWDVMLQCLYLNYDMEKDFSDQFEKNSLAIHELVKRVSEMRTEDPE